MEEKVSPQTIKTIDAAIRYLCHIGGNYTERGEEHPQQLLLDGLQAARDELTLLNAGVGQADKEEDVSWKKIDDNKVIHFWKQAEDDDCGEGPETAEVSPDWYECNGTPICACGRDLVYSHTEINLD